MISNWGMQYIIEKIFLRLIKYFLHMFQTHLIWRRYEHDNFWDNKSPSLGTLIWESWEKMLFGCSPHRESKKYYREGSGASSQRLQTM
jgi:hypothetical protein